MSLTVIAPQQAVLEAVHCAFFGGLTGWNPDIAARVLAHERLDDLPFVRLAPTARLLPRPAPLPVPGPVPGPPVPSISATGASATVIGSDAADGCRGIACVVVVGGGGGGGADDGGGANGGFGAADGAMLGALHLLAFDRAAALSHRLEAVVCLGDSDMASATTAAALAELVQLSQDWRSPATATYPRHAGEAASNRERSSSSSKSGLGSGSAASPCPPGGAASRGAATEAAVVASAVASPPSSVATAAVAAAAAALTVDSFPLPAPADRADANSVLRQLVATGDLPTASSSSSSECLDAELSLALLRNVGVARTTPGAPAGPVPPLTVLSTACVCGDAGSDECVCLCVSVCLCLRLPPVFVSVFACVVRVRVGGSCWSLR